MNQIVKIMSDGVSSEIHIEAETHEEAVNRVISSFEEKNQAGKLLSEEIKIFSGSGGIKQTIKNVLC